MYVTYYKLMLYMAWKFEVRDKQSDTDNWHTKYSQTPV